MRALLLAVSLVVIPTAVLAQAAIAGVVLDSSGAAVAGVVVEASSPELIEKLRTTISDESGRYRLENLRPGTYTVRFAHAGLSEIQRDGIELTGLFTATVDATLEIGPLSDTITVTAETSPLDVHGAKRELTLSDEIIRAIPTARSYNALVVLIPGVLTTSNDTVTGTATTAFPIHGGRTTEGRLLLDGLNVGSPPGGNSATSYSFDVGQAQEVTLTTSGALGESETAGLVMNIVPKAGGNSMRGSLFASGTGETFQSDNVTPELMAQGVTSATPFTKVYDVSGTLGGPILADRLWYFVHAHTGGSTRESTNVFYNLNAGEPTAVALRAGPQSARVFRSDIRERERPRHVAGDAAQHDQRILGRPVTLPAVHGCDAWTDGSGTSLAGSGRRSRAQAGCDPGDMVISDLEPAVPRGWLRRHVLRCGQLRARTESDARSDSRRRAVRERLRGERQHSRAGVSLAGLQRRAHRLVSVERLAVVRDRRTQREDRLSAHADDGRSDVVHQ